MQLAVSHLGFRPESPKTLTLLPEGETGLAAEIPFYVRQNCIRMPRNTASVEGFSARFPAPYDLLRGRLQAPDAQHFFYRGVLRKAETRWGVLWQADFSDLRTPGSYQIEIDDQISTPFAIQDRLYDRILRGYLTFLRAQRCGCAAFGVHPLCHADDGVLDIDGTYHAAFGGWHDAGDVRKWLAFTLFHVDALVTLRQMIGEELTEGGFAPNAVVDEIAWGNAFFHRMLAPTGQVYEDVAGGQAPAGSDLRYDRDWWFENHPGCFGDATDNRWTDNLLHSGDERRVRTTYNPLVQWTFVAMQARAASVLAPDASRECIEAARRAAAFGVANPHDGRTLFLVAELRAHLAMLAAGQPIAATGDTNRLARRLLALQERSADGLSGYFLEADGVDAYRSIAFAADPVLGLIELWQQRDRLGDAILADAARVAISEYIEGYLLPDADSNPFGLTPYGVYLHSPLPDRQLFRDAGQGRGVRTFLHPFNSQGIAHGTSSVLMSHAHLLAKAAVLFAQPSWARAAERLLQWCLGHNTLNRSLFTGIGYRQPTGYSYRIPQLPEAMVVGFIGRPDDTPYLEESNAIEWNTLEYWSMPYLHAAQTSCWLRGVEPRESRQE